MENARKKLENKRADLVVANDVTIPDAGFDADCNIATLVTAQKETPLPRLSKRDLAHRILNGVKEFWHE